MRKTHPLLSRALSLAAAREADQRPADIERAVDELFIGETRARTRARAGPGLGADHRAARLRSRTRHGDIMDEGDYRALAALFGLDEEPMPVATVPTSKAIH